MIGKNKTQLSVDFENWFLSCPSRCVVINEDKIKFCGFGLSPNDAIEQNRHEVYGWLLSFVADTRCAEGGSSFWLNARSFFPLMATLSKYC